MRLLRQSVPLASCILQLSLKMLGSALDLAKVDLVLAKLGLNSRRGFVCHPDLLAKLGNLEQIGLLRLLQLTHCGSLSLEFEGDVLRGQARAQRAAGQLLLLSRPAVLRSSVLTLCPSDSILSCSACCLSSPSSVLRAASCSPLSSATAALFSALISAARCLCSASVARCPESSAFRDALSA